mgnify:CR=1 FL=1
MVEISDGAVPAAALLMDSLVVRGNARNNRCDDEADVSAELLLTIREWKWSGDSSTLKMGGQCANFVVNL